MQPTIVSPMGERKQVVITLKAFVNFTVAEEEFAVDVLRVREVIRLPTLTVVPNVPEFVEGVIHLRGRIVPVIDLRKRLKIVGRTPKPFDKTTRVIIINFEGKWTGFIVDAVTGVMKIPLNTIKPAPDILVQQAGGEYFEGVIYKEERIIILLNLPKILAPEEGVKLRELDLEKIKGLLASSDQCEGN